MSDGSLPLPIPSRMHDCLNNPASVLVGLRLARDEIGLRTQQQHPHPPALAVAGPCVALAVTGCSGQTRAMLWRLTLRQSFRSHRSAVGGDCLHRRRILTGLEMAKEFEKEGSMF